MRVSITMATPLSARYCWTDWASTFWVNHCRSRSMVVRSGAPFCAAFRVLSRSGMRMPLPEVDC